MIKPKKEDITWCIAGLLGVAVLLFVWSSDEMLIKKITAEDGPVENLSALFYLFGFALCLFRVFTGLSVPGRRLWLYLWCILCFVFFGEEISWFQRLFKYSFPFMENLNAQGEVNIHNLNIFQGGHWIKAISSDKYGLKMFLSSQNIFRLGFFIYFLVIPIMMYAGKLNILKKKFGFRVPEARFVITVWSLLIISFVLAGFSEEVIKASIAETREMFYALFILIYIYTHLRPVKSNEKGETK